MNVLLVYAHPEPRSLNAVLKGLAIAALERAGHQVAVSDLYAARWRSEYDARDFPQHAPDARLHLARASKEAFAAHAQPPEVVAEQAKLLWADAVILQFPLWWYSMPAILKGWVDRVFAYGFAYGVGEHSDARWGDRFGEGTLAGKRAMLVVTAGGWEPHYSPRGINGPIDDLLFPINHGILFYPGFTVLPPYVAYDVDRLKPERFAEMARALESRMDTLFTAAPIPYRSQNGGDYELPSLQLRADREAAGTASFALHERQARLPR